MDGAGSRRRRQSATLSTLRFVVTLETVSDRIELGYIYNRSYRFRRGGMQVLRLLRLDKVDEVAITPLASDDPPTCYVP